MVPWGKECMHREERESPRENLGTLNLHPEPRGPDHEGAVRRRKRESVVSWKPEKAGHLREQASALTP